MNSIKKLFLNLYAIDFLVISFATFLTLLNLIFFDRIDNWATHILINTVVTIVIFFIAYMDAKTGAFFWKQLHYWYILPIIFATYEKVHNMVQPIRGVDFDQQLIAIDKFIFGVNPTEFMFQFANPILTEILQIAYSLFFFLPVILAIELLIRKDILSFRFIAFSIVLGFFLSYIGYFLVPGVGPRFTLHQFEMMNIELPGLWLTNYLREIVNVGGGIPTGTPNPMELVHRDVFPSGHTQMTLITIYLSFKLKAVSRHFILPVGILLFIATVYMRYHYVIDLVAGLFFMVLTMYLAKILFNWWSKIKNEEIFEY